MILFRNVQTPLDIERTTGPDRGQHLPGRAARSSSCSSTGRCPATPGSGRRSGTSGCAARRPIRAAGSWARTAGSPRWSSSGRAAGRRPERLTTRLDVRRRSSSAAATTRSSPPRTSRRPAGGCSSSSGGSASAARRRPPSSAASASRGWRTPSGGSGRRSCRDLDLALARPAPRRARRPRLRAAARRPGDHALDRPGAGPSTACAPGRAHDADAYPDFDRLVRSLGRFLGELAAETPPDIKAPGLGDALDRPEARAGRSAASASTTPTRSCGSCRWRSPTSSPRRSRPTRVQAAIAWRGVRYSLARAVVGGLGGDAAAATRPATTAARRARPCSPRAGPGALSEALARGGAGRRRRDPLRRGGRRDHLTRRPRRRASRSRPARRSPRSTVVSRRSTRSGRSSSSSTRSRSGPSMRWRAGNYPDPGRRGEGQPRRRPAAAVHRRGAATTRRCSAAGSSSRPASTRSSGRSTRRSTAGSPTTPVLEATIPSLVDPSLVEGAPAGTHVMSVIAQYTPYALRDGAWDDAGARRVRRRGRRACSTRSRRACRELVTRPRGADARSTSSASTA